MTDGDDLQRRNEALQARLDDLQARFDALQSALFGPSPMVFHAFGLTGSEATILALLLARDGLVSRDQLYAACYSLRTENEQPGPKIIDVFVCKLRKKLKKFGVSIETFWGVGYGLSEESSTKIKAMLQ